MKSWTQTGILSSEFRRTNKAGTGAVWPCGCDSLSPGTVWAWSVAINSNLTVGTADSREEAQKQADKVLRKAAREQTKRDDERVLPPDLEYTG